MSTGDIAMAERPKSTTFPEICNPAPGLTAEQFIDKIIALRPMIRAQQEQADAAGAYTAEVHEALLSFGAYGVVQPRRFGGHEFDPETLIRATIEMARSDPSAAWCWAFPAAHVIMLAAHYNEDAQKEIFGRNDGVAIAPLRAPTNGTIRKVEGGYIVNGTWDYGSGVPYATHVMPTARLIDDENPGPPAFYVPVVSAGDFRIVPGSWGGELTMGLRSSGSQTFVVDNVFVPENMVAPFYDFQRAGEDPEGTFGTRLHGNSMYLGLATSLFGAVISAVMVGAAWAALDEYEEILRTKKTINPPFHERYKSPEFQRTVGQVLMEIRAAEVQVIEVARLYTKACQQWQAGIPFAAKKDFLQSAMTTQAGKMAAEAIEKIFYAGGSSVAKKGQRLNRYYRDMATYRTHPIAQYDTAAEGVGQAHFDLPIPMLEAVGGARSKR
ncbi:acyl-CoA dehydrogenase family protein [Novosphingobium sp.]|uniref:acyl-CoA dehydrogenase family protein n=1 Tax=Novosphingobium sp. TaxID=1874826 RepID=UPI002B47379B|nr:acyl-CoA dehydrogenase family protein [Novosphingobium sp.]HKR93138.1 acyl-CoA dehydrogenase family protein [Novosphingobium sp.]